MASKIVHQFHSVHIVNHLSQSERKGCVIIADIFKVRLPTVFFINNHFLSRRRNRTIFHWPSILKSAPFRMLSGGLLLCFILQSVFLCCPCSLRRTRTKLIQFYPRRYQGTRNGWYQGITNFKYAEGLLNPHHLAHYQISSGNEPGSKSSLIALQILKPFQKKFGQLFFKQPL